MTGDTLNIFLPQHATFPASNFATPDLRNNHPVLDFDGVTDEEAYFESYLPANYGGAGITADIYVMFTSATSGTVRFQADFERLNAGGPDQDADSFSGTFQSNGGSANGTSGITTKVSVSFTNSQINGLLVGEPFRLKLRRDADGTSGTDDITTDAEVERVILREG